MPMTIPALRGKMGTTEYYLCTMQVAEFIRAVQIPKEMEGWEELTVEEKWQRDINYKRVRDHIAPYLANDDDRFVGSFIVTVMNDSSMRFESLEDANINVPLAYGDLKNSVGNIHLFGGETLVPLDGQHRLAALRFAAYGKDQEGRDIPNIRPNPSITEDTVSIILIRDDNEKSRKIFNKVNRYAKPTSKADNLITSDDDIVAVLNRDIVINELLGSRVVKMDAGNTLSDKAKEFTTIATTYEICKILLAERIDTKVNTEVLPNENDQNLYKRYIKEFWEDLIKIDAYQDSLQDISEEGDERRAEIRRAQIHCKPIMMRSIARAILRLTDTHGDESQSHLSVSDVVQRINNLDWSPENEHWQGIIMIGGKIMSGITAEQLAARYIAYLLGENMDEYDKDDLEKKYKLSTGGIRGANNSVTGGKDLPDPLYT